MAWGMASRTTARRRTRRTRRSGLRAVLTAPSTWSTLLLCGVGIEVVGVVIDLVVHLIDPMLAAREHLTSMENPGHLLLASGLALAVGGSVGHLTTSGLRERSVPQLVAAAGLTFLATVALGLAVVSAVAAKPAPMTPGGDHHAPARSAAPASSRPAQPSTRPSPAGTARPAGATAVPSSPQRTAPAGAATPRPTGR